MFPGERTIGPVDLEGIERLVSAGIAGGLENGQRPIAELCKECAGIVEQNVPRRAIQVLKEISVGNESRWASISPSDHFSLHCEIAFDHDAIGVQYFDYDSLQASFADDLSSARTFCLASDVEKMRAAGLALGGSLDNAIVIGDHGLLNSEGLRYDTEFARHKALDCIGDLSLAGAALLAHVESYCAGHTMNHELLNALLDDETAWCWTDMNVLSVDRIDAAPQVRHAAVAASA